MNAKVNRSAVECQEQPASLVSAVQGKTLTPATVVEGRELALLRQAIDESEWTHEALATVLPVPSAAYISRMLSGEKAWTTKHTDALPQDIRSKYRALAADDEGLIVVIPINDQQAAIVQAVSGLISLLRFQLPARADRMARATLDRGVERSKVRA
jgi:hypothetical protein